MKLKSRPIRELAGTFLFVVAFLLLAVDVIAAPAWRTWMLFCMLMSFFLSALLLCGWKEVVIIATISTVSLALWFYLEHLHESLSGESVKRAVSLSGRAGTLTISLVVAVFTRFLLPRSLGLFFTSAWRIIRAPGVLQALAHLFVSYLVLALAFAIAYASLYLQLGPTSFKSESQLQLFDFLYYSLFLPVSIGYPDIAPIHWMARLLSLMELLLGLVIIVLYLGVIVGRISGPPGEHQRR